MGPRSFEERFDVPAKSVAERFELEAHNRLRGLLDAARRHVDFFVLPSEFQAPWFEELGLPPDKLRVVPTGLDWDAFGADGERSVDPGGRTRFLFLGTLVPHKGAHLLLDAFAGLSPKLKERATLRIHGPSDSRPQYVEALRGTAEAAGVELGPRLDRDGVCLLYTSPSPRDQRGSRMPSSA